MRCSCWNSAVNLVDSGRCVVPVGTLWFDLNAATIHCTCLSVTGVVLYSIFKMQEKKQASTSKIPVKTSNM